MTSFLARYDHTMLRNLLLICAIGFLAHIIVSIAIAPIPQSDALDYHEHALRLANTCAYTAHDSPTAYRPVGFPALLAIIYVISPGIIAGFLLQTVLVTFSGLLIAFILKEYDASDRFAYLGCIIYLLLPMTWVQSMTFMSEPLAIMAMLMGVYLRIIQTTPLSRFMEGLFWGIAILTRPIMIFSAFGIFLHDMLKNSSKKLILIFMIGITLILFPWMIRNAIMIGSPMIASNTGINLLIGHNPEANGSYKIVGDMYRFDSLPEIESNASAMKSALDNIVNDPLHSISLIPKKIAFLFASDAYLPLQIVQVNGASYREKIHNLPSWSLILILPGSLLMFIGISHGKIMIDLPEGAYYRAIIFGMIIPCAIFFGTARYHESMIPFFVISIMLGINKNGKIFGEMFIASLALLLLWIIEYCIIFFS